MPPYSGYDPWGHGSSAGELDPVGQSPDPSAYYALSPGGRFPGDIWMYLEGQAATDYGPDRLNPYARRPDAKGAQVPGGSGPISKIINSFLRWHTNQVRQGGGDASSINNPLESGYPYQGWSGPGAPYGPEGGPLHGLLDMGADRPPQDMDPRFDPWEDPRQPSSGGKGGGGGGGGGGFGALNFTPYGGVQQQSKFVDWQPIAPYAPGRQDTRFVSGRGSSTPVPVPQKARPGKGAGGQVPGAGVGGGRGGGRGIGGGNPNPGTGTGGGRWRGGGGNQNQPPGSGQRSLEDSFQEFLRLFLGGQMPSGGTPTIRGRGETTSELPDPGFKGFDVGYQDRGTPGWIRDPTLGINNTAGMPLGTPPAQGSMTDDEYIRELHARGWDNESIAGLLNPFGTGEVVRHPEYGYIFDNDPRHTYETDIIPRSGYSSLFGPPGNPGEWGAAGGGTDKNTSHYVGIGDILASILRR